MAYVESEGRSYLLDEVIETESYHRHLGLKSKNRKVHVHSWRVEVAKKGERRRKGDREHVSMGRTISGVKNCSSYFNLTCCL